MKNIYKIVICITLVTIGLFSCKKDAFFDQKAELLNSETVFADSIRTLGFLSGLYGDIDFDIAPKATTGIGGIFSEVTDESEGRRPSGGVLDKVISSGSYGGAFKGKMAMDWDRLYADIRQANIFLAKVETSPLSAALKARTKAEARFLRAFYYHFLIKYFAGVPLIGDKIYEVNDPSDKQRNTYEECVEYLVEELDQAAVDLPLNYTGLDYGRVTKGACLALKSRILLFAASPLYNGGSFSTSPDVIKLTAYPSFDQNRWERARLAAKAVIDMGTYSLNVDNITKPGYGFYNLFLTRVNSEYIFAWHHAPNKILETAYNPFSRGGRLFYHYPTQEMVDKFPTINGLPVSGPDKDPAYKDNDPYLNRDPRLGYTIIYNTSLYYLQKDRGLSPVYTYVGAPQDGIVDISSPAATITGYYRRKGCDELAATTGGNNNSGGLPLIRYAEILLNYAEAANEMGLTTDAMDILKQIRMRAGIKPGINGRYGFPSNPVKDAARNLIKLERDVELAFEEHRLWDIRRWKDGNLLDGKFLTGMQITKIGAANPDPNTKYTYKLIPIRTRYFKAETYVWAIPEVELSLNPDILQNPGW